MASGGGGTSGERRRWVALFGAVIGLALIGCRERGDGAAAPALVVSDTELAAHRPVETAADEYVGSDACRECHARNHETWHASYHRTMTQLASPASILVEFNGEPITVEGRTYRFKRRGEQFWVSMPDPDAPFQPTSPELTRIERPIVLVTGSHYMQLYWYPTGHTRTLGLVPIHYFMEERKWLPTSATLLRPKTEFASDTGRWNGRCIQCHATHGRSRPLEDGGMDSQVAEFGISCEACHGPGERHVAFRRAAGREGASTDGSDPIVNPTKLSAKASSQVCGLCHSYTVPLSDERERRELTRGFDFRPGGELEKSLGLVRRDDTTKRHLERFKLDLEEYLAQRFWPDGMSRVAGREYNAMADSACHVRGELACASCHSMHKEVSDGRSLHDWADKQVKPGMETDAACTQCHATERYAAESHTHHGAGSSGSRCYNCHLPYTTYGLLRALRSHQVEKPSVATTKSTGRPNACNLCHLDRTLEWTDERLSEWYGQERVELSELERTRAASVMWALAGDAGQRALVGWHLGWGPAREASTTDWTVPLLTELMLDDYEAVRMIALRSLRTVKGFEGTEYDIVGNAGKRLEKVRAVRRTWDDESMSRRGARPEVLLDERGGLDRKAFQELFNRRDRRPVVLLE